MSKTEQKPDETLEILDELIMEYTAFDYALPISYEKRKAIRHLLQLVIQVQEIKNELKQHDQEHNCLDTLCDTMKDKLKTLVD